MIMASPQCSSGLNDETCLQLGSPMHLAASDVDRKLGDRMRISQMCEDGPLELASSSPHRFCSVSRPATAALRNACKITSSR